MKSNRFSHAFPTFAQSFSYLKLLKGNLLFRSLQNYAFFHPSTLYSLIFCKANNQSQSFYSLFVCADDTKTEALESSLCDVINCYTAQ